MILCFTPTTFFAEIQQNSIPDKAFQECWFIRKHTTCSFGIAIYIPVVVRDILESPCPSIHVSVHLCKLVSWPELGSDSLEFHADDLHWVLQWNIEGMWDLEGGGLVADIPLGQKRFSPGTRHDTLYVFENVHIVNSRVLMQVHIHRKWRFGTIIMVMGYHSWH